jgi:DNA-binding MarR family transcriptional regulator
VAREGEVAEVVNSLRRLFKAIQEHSKRIFRRTGLSAPQVWALRVLDGQSDRPHGTLAERLYAHPSTVSGIVDRLEKRAMVVRSPDPEDGRGTRLSLTAYGRRVARRSPPPVQLGLQQALERLPIAQLRRLRRVLQTVVQATAATDIEAPFFEVDSPRRRRRASTRPRTPSRT